MLSYLMTIFMYLSLVGPRVVRVVCARTAARGLDGADVNGRARATSMVRGKAATLGSHSLG